MDVNNLGTVFGPTIVRNPEAEKTQAKTSGLEEMAQANHVIKMLIQNTDTLFTTEDMERCKRVIFNVEKEIRYETNISANFSEPISLSYCLFKPYATQYDDSSRTSSCRSSYFASP